MVCAPVTVAQSPNLRLDRFGRVRFHERPPAYEPASSSRTGTKPDRRPRRAPLLIHAGDGKRVFRADRAFAIAEQLAEKLQLFLRYTTLALRQRLLQRLNEGPQLGMALEGLTAGRSRLPGTGGDPLSRPSPTRRTGLVARLVDLEHASLPGASDAGARTPVHRLHAASAGSPRTTSSTT